MPFWKFNPWDKHDKIIEGQHDHLYYGALADVETGVEKVDRKTYVLYGKEEALLVQPKNRMFRWGLEIVGAFKELIQ